MCVQGGGGGGVKSQNFESKLRLVEGSSFWGKGGVWFQTKILFGGKE